MECSWSDAVLDSALLRQIVFHVSVQIYLGYYSAKSRENLVSRVGVHGVLLWDLPYWRLWPMW